MRGGSHGHRPRTVAVAAAAAVLPLLLLAACSGRGSDDPGAIGADESAQLNDAAAMLDANSIDLNAVTSNDTDAP